MEIYWLIRSYIYVGIKAILDAYFTSGINIWIGIIIKIHMTVYVFQEVPYTFYLVLYSPNNIKWVSCLYLIVETQGGLESLSKKAKFTPASPKLCIR